MRSQSAGRLNHCDPLLAYSPVSAYHICKQALQHKDKVKDNEKDNEKDKKTKTKTKRKRQVKDSKRQSQRKNHCEPPAC